MTKFFGDEPAAADDLNWDDIESVECPICESTNLEYNGEIYDDDEHRGSGFICNDCGFHFDEMTASEMDE